MLIWQISDSCLLELVVRANLFSTYAKLTFLTPSYAHVLVSISRSEMLVFWKILLTY